jgi:hypothetical protein
MCHLTQMNFHGGGLVFSLQLKFTWRAANLFGDCKSFFYEGLKTSRFNRRSIKSYPHIEITIGLKCMLASPSAKLFILIIVNFKSKYGGSIIHKTTFLVLPKPKPRIIVTSYLHELRLKKCYLHELD